MIFIMALIGAVTRLTESGLSITRWEPVKGALPPLSEKGWQEAFDLYRATPQYRAINQGMKLEDFKKIYFWEWLHRLWGRLIGLVYAAGLAFFWLRRQIPKGYKTPLAAALALGGLQGLVGWLMVKSGLQPGTASVSPLGLAAHLSLAFALFGFLYIQMLRLVDFPALKKEGFRLHGWTGFILLCFAIFWGVLTAGLDAGKIYNSFPAMNGQWLPSDALALEPFLRNLVENPAMVQFMHRALTITTGLTLLWLGWRLYRKAKKKEGKQAGLALLGLSLLQPALGIATLLTGVNITLAVLHQAGALLLLMATLTALYIIEKKEA
jgi:cytochrome c oxidase assembly protein subunit 15